MTFDRSAPVLLFTGDHYGTLALARALGRAGIAVALADPKRVTRAGASRFVRRRLACPDAADTEAFLEWLTAFGEREPGHVLFPSSDALAWLFARHAPAFARSFRLYAPPFATVLTLLDKKRLHDAAQAVGLAVPHTVALASEEELREVAPRLPYPVVLKPRTQAFLASGHKGGLVSQERELLAAVRTYRAHHTLGAEAVAVDSTLPWPMAQEFFPDAETNIYGLSGFVGRDGGPTVMRAARKVLQRPRRFGIGVCFEAAPVNPRAQEGLVALLEAVGYFGIFEAELVEARGRLHLIDFNPRPYSQIAFDEARGLPLALLHYLGATGQTSTLEALLGQAAATPYSAGEATAYHHRLLLDGVRVAQWAARRLYTTPAEPWGTWLSEHEGRAADAVRAEDDPLPAALDVGKHLSQALRHPRSFVRSFRREG